MKPGLLLPLRATIARGGYYLSMPEKPAKESKWTRKDKGDPTARERIADDKIAMIWILREQGLSQRAIAERVLVTAPTVHRELSRDPIRLEAIIARQREDEARGWQKIASKGRDETNGWLELCEEVRLGDKGKKKLSAYKLKLMALAPSYLRAVQLTANQSAKLTQLLTGGATERIDGTVQTNSIDASTAEQLIEQALELDQIGLLPPYLRPRAELEKAKRAGQTTS